MVGRTYVVVSGPPASGKSTLAPVLAESLRLPLLAKDTIKDALMVQLGARDVEESRRLGRAAVAVMLAVAADSPVGAVLESSFFRSKAVVDLGSLPGRVVEVFCRCHRDVAAARFSVRAGTRAAGHFDAVREPEELWNDEVAEPVQGCWPVIEVDTERAGRSWRRPGRHTGGDDRFTYINLFAFANKPAAASSVVAAGATGVVVDWERRGKRARQAGADTQINADTPDDLAAVRAAHDGTVLCRVNRWSAWTPAEIDLAVSLGTDEVLLPMVRRVEEVDAALEVVAGRCGLGILVETVDAVRNVEALAARPLSRIYLGLNDLRIDRGGGALFLALVDGTADRVAVAAANAGTPFGVAGLTLPEAGRPVPCRLVVGALARVGASFTFLRRSFWADTAGRDLAVEVPRILAAVDGARRRAPEEVAVDHAELTAAVALLSEDEAV